MSNYVVGKNGVFTPQELRLPRMVVEKQKLEDSFPQFQLFQARNGSLILKGDLRTSYGNTYAVRITLPEGYPYASVPVIEIANTLHSNCPHKYNDGTICIMRNSDWSSTLSLVFVVAKTAVWLNKYDYWCRHGRWPGHAHGT